LKGARLLTRKVFSLGKFERFQAEKAGALEISASGYDRPWKDGTGARTE
jgi:hypothetical protein